MMNSKDEYTNVDPAASLDLVALRAACEGVTRPRNFVPLHPVAVLHLLDQLEAAQKDAARIDWLIGQDNCVVAEGLNGFWPSWIDEHDQRRTKYQDGSYPSARAAIDAAMAATKGEEA